MPSIRRRWFSPQLMKHKWHFLLLSVILLPLSAHYKIEPVPTHFPAKPTIVALRAKSTPQGILGGKETGLKALPTSTIEAYVVKEAKIYNINPDLATCIVEHESQWIIDKVGPETKGKSQGLWQIYNLAHPNITQAQAFDPVWSTNWALTQIKNGNVFWWSTYSAKPFYCKNIQVMIN